MPGVKLLADSEIFRAVQAAAMTNAISQIQAGVTANFPNVWKNIPNEANGDTIPPGSAFLTGSGILKVNIS